MAADKKASDKLGLTRQIKKPRFTSKPLRPDEKNIKKKLGRQETAYERLARLAQEEENIKDRERLRKKAASKGQNMKTNGKGGLRPPEKIRENENSLMIGIAVSVLAIIVVLWVLSSIFLSGMAKKHTGIASGTTKKTQTSEKLANKKESETESKKAESEKAPESSKTEESKKPAQITQGDAEFRVPESWVGKSFAVKDDANVRTGPGTVSGVCGSVDPGDIIEVHKAESLDDATWLYGIITKKDGGKIEGWVYAYAVSPAAR